MVIPMLTGLHASRVLLTHISEQCDHTTPTQCHTASCDDAFGFHTPSDTPRLANTRKNWTDRIEKNSEGSPDVAKR